MSHLQKAGIPVVWHGRMDGEPAPYCNSCMVPPHPLSLSLSLCRHMYMKWVLGGLYILVPEYCKTTNVGGNFI